MITVTRTTSNNMEIKCTRCGEVILDIVMGILIFIYLLLMILILYCTVMMYKELFGI